MGGNTTVCGVRVFSGASSAWASTRKQIWCVSRSKNSAGQPVSKIPKAYSSPVPTIDHATPRTTVVALPHTETNHRIQQHPACSNRRVLALLACPLSQQTIQSSRNHAENQVPSRIIRQRFLRRRDGNISRRTLTEASKGQQQQQQQQYRRSVRAWRFISSKPGHKQVSVRAVCSGRKFGDDRGGGTDRVGFGGRGGGSWGCWPTWSLAARGAANRRDVCCERSCSGRR